MMALCEGISLSIRDKTPAPDFNQPVAPFATRCPISMIMPNRSSTATMAAISHMLEMVASSRDMVSL